MKGEHFSYNEFKEIYDKDMLSDQVLNIYEQIQNSSDTTEITILNKILVNIKNILEYNKMLVDLKGLHDLEESGRIREERQKEKQPSSLLEKIRAAQKEFREKGTEKLTNAKKQIEELIISNAKSGKNNFTIDNSHLISLGTEEQKEFKKWLSQNGVEYKYCSDPRDNDTYVSFTIKEEKDDYLL